MDAPDNKRVDDLERGLPRSAVTPSATCGLEASPSKVGFAGEAGGTLPSRSESSATVRKARWAGVIPGSVLSRHSRNLNGSACSSKSRKALVSSGLSTSASPTTVAKRTPDQQLARRRRRLWRK